MAASWIRIAVYLLVIGLLGYVLPSRMGFDFLDPVNIAGYAALAPVFTAARIGESRRAVWMATLFGFVSMLLALILALITVNQRYRFGKVLMPEPAVLLASLVFALAVSYFAAVLGARLLARGWSVFSVKAALRRSVLLILLVLLLSGRFVPPRWRTFLGSLLTDQGIVYLLLGATVVFGAIGLVLDRRSAGRLPG
jgi:hypothetical protein